MTTPVRILHVEDDVADARLIQEHLRRSGIDAAITLVASREDFEGTLSDRPFDLVLCDYHLRGFDGLEALELVRKRSPQVPFILVTGALGDERAVELLRKGATDFVLKDRLARLAPAIQRALFDRNARKDHEEVQARLAEAQRLSKLAAEAARLGTWRFDIPSGRLDCSDDFLTLIGVRRVDWGGTADALEAIVHPEDLASVRRFYRDADQPGSFKEIEFRMQTPDGEVRWLHARGDRVLEGDGAAAVFVGVMMDVTERKQTEEALRIAGRRKDEFLAVLAHELRNPLAPIYNGIALLRRSGVQSSEAEKIHAMLERQMTHMSRLLDDLLDVSRLTLGKIELKRAPVHLQTVVRSAVEMSQAFIEAAQHRLEVSMPSAPVTLDVDSVRLTQVLSNLLNNAAKYTEQGGHIWVAAEIQDGGVAISVRDTGVGIPEGMLDQVFDLFTQVDGRVQGGVPGLGVGLAMVRSLIELHGGEVEARSAGPGKGSEFVVRLPVSTATYASSAQPADAKFAAAPLPRRRVLVIDDNCDAADSLGLMLQGAGAEAHVVYDGVDALKAMPAYLPDVVLLDIGMPGMDGYSVASQIRQDPRYEKVTLVALTGYGQESDRLRSRAAGFDHHLTKPADLKTLEALFASLEHREQDQRAVQNLQ
jgi:two-component system CheB/CheR fusion protein